MKLSKIAEILGIRVDIPQEIEIVKLNTLQEAKEGELSFLENEKYIKYLPDTQASAVLISEKHIRYLPENTIPLITETPYIDLAKISRYFASPIEIDEVERVPPQIGKNCKIAKSVYIGSDVKIGNNVTILHNSYIGDRTEIGDNSIIYPNVTIYRDTKIGKDVTIHSNSVIGSDGFGFATDSQGNHIKIFQNGNVVIEDRVEIGSNVSIDRAVFNSTYIRKGARIDNLVQIGHNCDIGENVVLVSQVGIAGSTKLGKSVVVGGQAGIAGHLKIAPFSTITAKAGVSKSIKKSGKIWSGYPLFEHSHWLKLQAKISKLLKG
ncbi:MAG TPA: UDP-3-O-(3-hydroxymyristoyl)glucosamine N-acyltransferase [Campylobacterales bacterium]|nr:UDP-3-O-(3-hydroxymyristoyl)glucosamine N-acyltransferase [Campylobacterales bacterium]HIO71017.1 UDP-3-O-(3-hydroxymyristoyl)glucosamine N-acyltransferase [Campylobacterales bacterium]